MKTILTIAGFFCCLLLAAQVPQKMSYQSVIRNSDNELLVNQEVGVRISILRNSASGTVVYSERHSIQTNSNGLISLEIGTGTVLSGTFVSIDWGVGPYFIRTEIDPSGGSSYSISITNQFMSVPYALFAENSGNPGPQGPRGPEGPQGVAGPQGPAGPEGPAGKDGSGVSILGSLNNPSELPATGNNGDAYLINGELYVWNGSAWENVGNIQGPAGSPGPQGAQGADGAQGPAGPQGETGPQGPAGADGAQGPQGEPGPQGPEGPAGKDGSGVSILGSLNNPSELPASGNNGDAYLINGELYVWNGSAWENVGNIQGPAGADGAVRKVKPRTRPAGPQGETGRPAPQGPAGADGAQGPAGPQGEPGPQGPAGADGAQGPQGEPGPQGPEGPAGKGWFGSFNPRITQQPFRTTSLRQ
jgi:hypothetical protein